MPHPDSPIQDPYLGRQALLAFDRLIPTAMDVNIRVAAWTHEHELTRLQRAACQIIPNGFSIALSIRELVRAAYLFSAEILLRPLLERVAVVSYLIDEGAAALDLWEQGWPYKSRPPLSKMLAVMTRGGADGVEFDSQVFLLITEHFNALIHADPAGLDTNIGHMGSGSIGYLSAANLNAPTKCDDVCKQTTAYTASYGESYRNLPGRS